MKDDDSLVILDFESIVDEINPMDTEKEDALDIAEEIKDKNKLYNVLLADDSKLVRKQMGKILGKLGFNSIIVENGKQALAKLNELKKSAKEEGIPLYEKVAIVITDIEMPQMDGYTLTTNIKNDPELSKLPVVMHTSLSGSNVKKRGLEVGADEYLTKFSTGNVKKTLFEVIKKWYN
jgi:two-component system chemotaxis response regulator CheV